MSARTVNDFPIPMSSARSPPRQYIGLLSPFIRDSIFRNLPISLLARCRVGYIRIQHTVLCYRQTAVPIDSTFRHLHCQFHDLA